MVQPLPTPQHYDYPEGFRPRRLTEQIASLERACAKIKFTIDARPAKALALAMERREVPAGFEMWQAALRPGILGENPFQDRHLALELLGQISGVPAENRFANELAENELFKKDPNTEKAIAKMVERQRGDVFIFPMQSGRRYAGMVDREAIGKFNVKRGEFGLDLLTGASHLVTHPKRLAGIARLDLGLPGDRFDYKVNTNFSRIGVVKLIQQRITLMHFPVHAAWANDHGLATGELWLGPA